MHPFELHLFTLIWSSCLFSWWNSHSSSFLVSQTFRPLTPLNKETHHLPQKKKSSTICSHPLSKQSTTFFVLRTGRTASAVTAKGNTVTTWRIITFYKKKNILEFLLLVSDWKIDRLFLNEKSKGIWLDYVWKKLISKTEVYFLTVSQCGLVPNTQWTNTGPWTRGWPW